MPKCSSNVVFARLMTQCTVDSERRFGGIGRLYGPDAPELLKHAHVMVVGMGGVGSWAAEALARSAVGALTLVDMDHVAESNINRQVHALSQTLGQSKIGAMADRIAQINPDCQIHQVDDFLNPDNASDLIHSSISMVLDCTDQVKAKVAMVVQCRLLGVPLLVSGGAGGKTQSLALKTGDLSESTHDALLARMRNILRRDHGYPRPAKAKGSGKSTGKIPKMGVRVLWVDQPTRLPDAWQVQDGAQGLASGASAGEALQGLSCAGYGSAVTVTASMGLAAAGHAIEVILHRARQSGADAPR